ncbi:hypothetical protein EDD18DRAFT_1060672, partial [Armillaria luteobubalina]
LALHLFSVCANSASCEWLFSVLGNTLTKLCNHLGTKTLTSLAEMKMHICDEHLQMAGKAHDRLKCNFGKCKDPFTPLEMPGTTDQSDGEVNHSELFEGITEQMSCRVQEDEDTTLDDSEDQDLITAQDSISISIEELFNFDSRDWIATHQHSATQSLAEEMEFYELCGLDGDGDEGLDIDIDDTLASIVHI